MVDIKTLDHDRFMRQALQEAEAARRRGDLPVGAVVVHANQVMGRGSNTRVTRPSQVTHAEFNALLSCWEFLRDHHHDCILYSTLEPCPMCLGAIVMWDLHHVIFGAFDYRAGATHMVERVPYVAHHIHTYLGGVLEHECLDLIRQYSQADADVVEGKVHPFRTPPQLAR